ncbi:MAG: alpha/beta hydrolase [Nocardioides sp.]
MTSNARRVAVGATVAVLGAVAVAGWVGRDYLDRDDTSSPGAALAEQCDEVPTDAERVTVTGADGFTLGAALVGPEDARIGLLLRHGASQTICDWLPWAGEVAEATGVRVMLFDRRGNGSSPGAADLGKESSDTARAYDELRAAGVDRTAVMASSMGNSVMFPALPRLSVPPCAVISVSPVLSFADDGGAVDGTSTDRLTDNVWIAWETGNAGVADNAGRIAAEAGRGGVAAHELPVDTADHSIKLVLDHREVRDFLTDAVRSCGS